VRVLVITPTYDERLSLPGTLARLRAAVPDADVLVVDDASPDGTGDLADEVAARDAAVRVLHRPGKQGLGAAYRAGFRWGLAEGYDVLVEMDADGSHQPEQLPRLLERLERPDRADVVIGSRWVRGGSVRNWPLRREGLSRGANLYTRAALGIPVRDSTAGFRAYRREVLEKIALDEVRSQGYCFQVDLTLRALAAGFEVREVPIDFVEREQGTSKMSGDIVREALVQIVVWGVRRRGEQVREAVARSREGRWHS
jgi:dolichol-phosphate mannosyltransferase